MPIPSRFVDCAMQDFKDCFLGCFYLSITLGVIDGRPMLCNFEPGVEHFQILVLESSSIVNDYGGGYTIPTNDIVQNEHSHCLAICYSEGNYFYPLGEVIYGGGGELVSIQ